MGNCSKVCNGENDIFEINMKRDRKEDKIKYIVEIDKHFEEINESIKYMEDIINEKVELKIIEDTIDEELL